MPAAILALSNRICINLSVKQMPESLTTTPSGSRGLSAMTWLRSILQTDLLPIRAIASKNVVKFPNLEAIALAPFSGAPDRREGGVEINSGPLKRYCLAESVTILIEKMIEGSYRIYFVSE